MDSKLITLSMWFESDVVLLYMASIYIFDIHVWMILLSMMCIKLMDVFFIGALE